MLNQPVSRNFPTDPNPPEAEGPALTAVSNRAAILGEAAHPKNTRCQGQRQQSAELRNVAKQVQRIGYGYRTDPESNAIAKDGIAKALVQMARRIGGAT